MGVDGGEEYADKLFGEVLGDEYVELSKFVPTTYPWGLERSNKHLRND